MRTHILLYFSSTNVLHICSLNTLLFFHWDEWPAATTLN